MRVSLALKFADVAQQAEHNVANVDVAGSIPAFRSIELVVRRYQLSAHVAQSVEHFLGKEEVTGSIPVMSTTSSVDSGYRLFLFLNF